MSAVVSCLFYLSAHEIMTSMKMCFLGPYAGAHAELQEDVEAGCPSRRPALPGPVVQRGGLLLGLWGRRTTGTWRHHVRNQHGRLTPCLYVERTRTSANGHFDIELQYRSIYSLPFVVLDCGEQQSNG